MKSYVIQLQTVLYKNEPQALLRSLDCIANALEVAKKANLHIQLTVVYGDASPDALFSKQEAEDICQTYRAAFSFQYAFFNQNTGTALGHNRLSSVTDSEYIMIMNPDILVSPVVFERLLAPYERGNLKVGITEARQTPIEHHKYYDLQTGQTSWASTACVIIAREAFNAVDGFDANTFFMYCDDVDFSWMVRLKGYEVIYCPDAMVFHDKKLSNTGNWIATAAEKYYSAEAALLMSHKWSNPDRVKMLLKNFSSYNDEDSQKAVEAFRKRQDEKTLPSSIDPTHKIANFTEHGYGEYRFVL